MLNECCIDDMYKIARSVSHKLYISGFSDEDKIQECVIHAWQKLDGEYTPIMYNYVRRLMYNKLISLLRGRRAIYKFWKHSFDENSQVFAKQEVVIVLPVNLKHREIVYIMLECNCSIIQASAYLGMPYNEVSQKWRRAKEFIRSNVPMDSMLYDTTFLTLEGRA